jgi:hypothetical protein
MDNAVAIVLAVLTVVGGIVAGYVTFRLNKSKELEFLKREQKEKRYKSAILHMAAYLEDDFEYLVSRPEITTKEQVKAHLRAEYHQMIFYASREVVISVRAFIKKPTQKSYASVLLAMRKDLWIKKQDLTVGDIELDKPSGD